MIASGLLKSILPMSAEFCSPTSGTYRTKTPPHRSIGIIPRFPLHNPRTLPSLAEHVLKVFDDSLGNLPCRKMSSLLMHLFIHNFPQRSPPQDLHRSATGFPVLSCATATTYRTHTNILGKVAQAKLHLWNPRTHAFFTRAWILMRSLVVDPNTSRRSRGTELVDAHPRQHFIISPSISIRPIM
jgi:hypothetical protein